MIRQKVPYNAILDIQNSRYYRIISHLSETRCKRLILIKHIPSLYNQEYLVSGPQVLNIGSSSFCYNPNV